MERQKENNLVWQDMKKNGLTEIVKNSETIRQFAIKTYRVENGQAVGQSWLTDSLENNTRLIFAVIINDIKTMFLPFLIIFIIFYILHAWCCVVMVLNITFNIISVISWRSVLLVGNRQSFLNGKIFLTYVQLKNILFKQNKSWTTGLQFYVEWKWLETNVLKHKPRGTLSVLNRL